MRANTVSDLYAGFERMPNGCLEWTRARFEKGYGAFQLQGKQWRTHRLVWTLENGPISPGIEILHRCDNPPCGDIAHLFAGIQLENMTDMIAKGRKRTGTYERTAAHRLNLRELRLAGSAAKYGADVPRAGDVTDLPQRVPPSVPAGAPLKQRTCAVCGQAFLVPAVLAERYRACSRPCSSVLRSQVKKAHPDAA